MGAKRSRLRHRRRALAMPRKFRALKVRSLTADDRGGDAQASVYSSVPRAGCWSARSSLAVVLSDAARLAPARAVPAAARPRRGQRGVPAADQDVQRSRPPSSSIVLAMILLGPAPAAVPRRRRDAVDSCRRRRSPWRHGWPTSRPTPPSRCSARVLFEAVGGRAARDATCRSTCSRVFALFMAMNVLNFLLIGIDFAVVDGQNLWSGLRHVYLPVLPGRVRHRPAHRRRRARLRATATLARSACSPSSASSSSTCCGPR